MLRGLCTSVAAAALCISAPADCKTVDAAALPGVEVSDTLVSKVQSAIGADTPRLRRLFSELHHDTRVGRVEALRAAVIGNELLALGLDVEFGAEGTEVVATLRHGPGPTLLYRADTGADIAPPPRSKRAVAGANEQPSEHRCGYDAQLVWMLGMVKALTALPSEWEGTLVLVAQPTRLLREGSPTLKASSSTRALPRPDLVLAISAGPAPVGSVLAVRGARPSGAAQVGVTLSRFGIYTVPEYLDQVSRLATGLTQHYGLPDGTAFGYLLVGVAEPTLAASSPAQFDAAAFYDLMSPSRADFAAIPLGAKLAAVAVLELLKKQTIDAPQGNGSGWTPHDY
jgi:hypothetical protein